MRIYLDNAATTPISEEVIEVMHSAMKDLFGNPSSIHAEGRKVKAKIEEARKKVAHYLNASIGEIFFTSGGTESNNMAIKGAVRDLGVRRIISSPLEHHCVLHCLDTVREEGVQIDMVKFDRWGRVDFEHLETLLQSGVGSPQSVVHSPQSAVKPSTVNRQPSTVNRKPSIVNRSPLTLVSLMHANNEISTVQDMQTISELCEKYGALYHSDTVQTIGHLPIDVAKTKIHFLAGGAHKFHGPKGCGFIYINNETQLKPMIEGGSQERNVRGGTENVYGIAGLSKALELACENLDERRQYIEELRHYMMEQLQSNFVDIQFNGDYAGNYLFTVLNVSFPPSPKATLLLLQLDIAGISVSGGSACSSGADAGSHVLTALGVNPERKAIRFSFSHYNTKEEIDAVIEKLKEFIETKRPVLAV